MKDGFPEAGAPARDRPIGQASSKPRGYHRERLIERDAAVVNVAEQAPSDPRRDRAVAGMEHPGPDRECFGNEHADGGGKPHHAEQHYQQNRRGEYEAEYRERLVVGIGGGGSELPRAEHDHQRANNHRDEIAKRNQQDAQQQPSEAVHASVQSVIAMARSARRSRAESFSVALLSWPHAARMSRPRGVRTGEA